MNAPRFSEKPFEVINVAGLLMNGKDDGIENELRSCRGLRFIRTIAPTPPLSARENTLCAVKRAVGMIRETQAEIARLFDDPNTLVIGRSFGGFIGILAALDMDFDGISKAISIEAPLHPDVMVKAPALLPPLHACTAYYRERPDAAAIAFAKLRSHGEDRVIAIQGSREDAVVPVAAQTVPDVINTVRLSPQLGGVARGPMALLPHAYQNHLCWSKEKMRAVREIIEQAA